MAYTGLQLSKNKDILLKSVITQLDLAENSPNSIQIQLHIPDLAAPCEPHGPCVIVLVT